MVGFDALADDEVLPQGSCVLAQGQRGEVLEDGVAYAVIIKVYFLSFLQLGTQVAVESVQAEYDIAFL